MSRKIDRLILHGHRNEVLQRENLYLSSSNVEVFEAGRVSSRRQRMDEEAFTSYLSNKKNLLPEEPLFRAIFITDTPGHTDRLQLSTTAFPLLLDRFSICSRLAGMMHLQMTPSRKLHYDPDSKKLLRIQYIYSHVLRSLKPTFSHNDPTKSVLDWQRFVHWTGRDMVTGATTMVILRCPLEAQEQFIKQFGDQGEAQAQLLLHPMLAHAFFTEKLNIRQNYFSGDWARPIYKMEANIGYSATEWTSRARRFMVMARQIGNVLTDYEIYMTSLRSLQEICQILRDADAPAGLSDDAWRDLRLDFDDTAYFGTILDHTQLLKTYGMLYKERCQLNYNELTALMNQRELEVSKSMSAESTIIARSSHRDGQSLRIIQYLGLIFLPLSLCTSIFGMAFFDTSFDPNDHSRAIFSVSDSWWWFIAVGLPFAVLVMLVTYVSVWWSTKQVEERRKSDVSDLEKVLTYEMSAFSRKNSENDEDEVVSITG